uniref:Uncharacterized protein n=1 Tax=Lotus japonicus TaxID=34305 RepID=I3S4L7_LOTJA|nr:unknown [Lotus japonicus]
MASLGGSLNSAATSYASILADVEKLQTLFSDPKVFDYFSNPIVRVEDKAGAEAHWSKNVRIKTQLDPSLVAVRYGNSGSK